MARPHRILGLVLAAFVVVLAGDVADTCAALTAGAGCCCPMMAGGNAPCKELSQRGERTATSREEGAVSVPSATASAAAPASLGADEGAAALPAESVAAAASAHLPLYLRHCSLLN